MHVRRPVVQGSPEGAHLSTRPVRASVPVREREPVKVRRFSVHLGVEQMRDLARMASSTTVARAAHSRVAIDDYIRKARSKKLREEAKAAAARNAKKAKRVK